jgi:hypothetical protein
MRATQYSTAFRCAGYAAPATINPHKPAQRGLFCACTPITLDSDDFYVIVTRPFTGIRHVQPRS